MHTFHPLCVFVACLGLGSAGILDFIGLRSATWNSLKVKWGINPFNSNTFDTMPRTAQEAADEGFVKISECDSSPTAKHRGARYTKNGDNTLVILLDKNGVIAGIQTVIPKGLPYDYPKKGLTPPFVEMSDGFYLTAYFVPPETICSVGRSEDDLDNEGTGTHLFIQNGNNPDTDLITIPLLQSDLAGTLWTEGRCFRTMGVHYWYNLTLNTNCDDFMPVFLMYNQGRLNAFGWAIGADLNSPRYEHPPRHAYSRFMRVPPSCLYERGRLTTQHIYLTSTPRLNFC